jgi:hypothetical protein
VLDAEKGWETGAFIAFPSKSKWILQDLRPTDMSPILVDRSHEMHAIQWKEIPRFMERGGPVFLYRGLYAHYLSKTSVKGDAWFQKTWVDHLETKGFQLKPIFEYEMPFYPHHVILDRTLVKETYSIGLYRVEKSVE